MIAHSPPRGWVRIAVTYPFGSQSHDTSVTALRVVEAFTKAGHEVKARADATGVYYYARIAK